MAVIERFIGVVAPHKCLKCANEGALICEWCLPDAFSGLPSRCYRCLAATVESKTCKNCQKHDRPGFLWVAAKYEGLAKELIHVLKFGRARAAHKIIAKILDEKLPYLDNKPVVSYIPTATKRRRQRGYDQSELVAKEFARLRGLEYRRTLSRTGQTRQVGAARKQRLQQMEGVFVISNKVNPKRAVLIVDDLVTTGATVESATKTLKAAGVKRVYAAVFAQK